MLVRPSIALRRESHRLCLQSILSCSPNSRHGNYTHLNTLARRTLHVRHVPLVDCQTKMGSSTNKSHFGAAPYIQPDAIFELTKRFEEDNSPQKVNLGQGTYRDENGDPWVLPSVRAAKEALGSVGHEYLPIRGLQKFCDRASKLVLHDTSALRENRVSYYDINQALAELIAFEGRDLPSIVGNRSASTRWQGDEDGANGN